MRANNFFSVWITLVFIIGPITLCLPSAAMAVSSSYRLKANNSDLINKQKDDYSNILSVLEKKIGDRELIEKARGKLSTLSDGEIRLISSLCDRITHDSHSADADVAFLLIATLIIFS
jgi:hypothetical protein